jgi:hypothetical protein
MCLALLVALAFPGTAVAQNIDNKGKDFYLPFLPNLGAPTAEVHLTSDVATTVNIEYPVNAPTFTTSVSVTPGNITIVQVPATAAQGWTLGAVANNAVRAFSDEPFIAYMINRAPFTSDAALALPVEALNTEYIVKTYFSNIVSSDRGEFGVVAPFNNTTVEIVPSNNLAGPGGGFPAGTPFTITLDQGEGFLGQSVTFGTNGDLTGTIISADKPVAVTNGNRCTNVPPTQTFCDHIFQFAHPLQSWGTSALVSNLPNLPDGAVYRILAAEDNTTVQQNGTTVATLNRGEFYETGRLTGNHQFSGDNPIFVTQFMTGINPGNGDPAMGSMIPQDQYLSNYTFSTVGGNQFAQNFLTVIAENADVGTLLLDGSPIPATEFTAIGTTGFSAATVPLTEGTHTTSSTGRHGITVLGINDDDSYIYPGGALFDFINPVVDQNPPECEGSLDGQIFFGSVSDEEDADDTGVFFVQLGEGSTNLALTVSDFDPGDSPVTYTVERVDATQPGSGTVVGTDGSGNTCSIDVNIPVDTPEDTTPPICADIDLEFNGPGGALSAVATAASDPESGIASATFTTLQNLDGFVGGFGPFVEGDAQVFDPASTPSVDIRGERISYTAGGAIVVTVENGAGLTSDCDPVVEQISASIPERTALLGNYPNPAIGSTTIEVRVAEPGPVRLEVYDLLGRKVSTLLNREMTPGTYQVEWTRSETAQLASGTYIYRLEAGAVTESRRLTLLR